MVVDRGSQLARGTQKRPPARAGGVGSPIPYLADSSAGVGTLRRVAQAAGLHRADSLHPLDKAVLFSCCGGWYERGTAAVKRNVRSITTKRSQGWYSLIARTNGNDA